MKVTNKIDIHLDDKRLLPPISVMQADAYTRVLEFALYSGGVAWEVPSDASVAVAYSGASGRGIYDTLPDGSAACTVAGNVVTAVVAPQAIAMHGKTQLTVVFTDGDGYQIATFCVTLDVAANPAVGAVKPSDYINLRQWMTAELAALLEEMGVGSAIWVKVTQQGIDGIAADKGYTELYAAYVAGHSLCCQLPDGAVLALVSADETGVVFQGEVNREYQKVVITSDDTVTYTSGKYALVGEVAKTYTVLVFPGGDGYTTEDGIDDILAACESSATVVCDVELDGEQACLRLPLVKYNATAAYFGAVFDGKEYLVTITADGVTLEVLESAGQPGADGATYTPQVVAGTLYWTNDKNLGNPVPARIQGEDGADGKSAYEYAQEGGYTGTEAEFAAKLAADQSVFRVTLTPNGDGTATADKTLDELVAAREAGRCVQVVFDDMILQEQLSPNANFMYGFTLFDNGEVVSYFAIPLDEETAWGVSKWFESTTTNCIPYYYDEFKCAITDLSGGYPQNKMSDTSNHTPSVKVFTSDTGVKTIMLLTDVTVTEAITIGKSCDIVLNGHKLTFSGSAAYLNIAEGIDCTIWGNVDGSAIVKEGITTTDTSTVMLMAIRGDNVKLIGGEYIFGGSVNGSTVALASTAACNNLEIDGCTITVENTSDTSVGVLYGFQNAASNTVIRNSTITVNGVVNTIGGIRNSGGLTLEKSTVKVALSADGVLKGAYAITNSNTLIAEDSYILADSKGTSVEDDEPASGISNGSTGTARLKNMTISGTHSAVQNNGKLYISGGTYTGYCHGGIYFSHGADGIGYVNDATLRDGNYEGAFTDYFDALTYKNWGAFYVGGGSDACCSNMTVYMDNCTIEGVTTAFCMRGSSGETNNTVNLSNCTIVDGANRPINFHNTTHTVNIGVGGNITSAMSNQPTCLKFTGKLYRKMHGDKVLDGKDYVALAEKVESGNKVVLGELTLIEDVDHIELPLSDNPLHYKELLISIYSQKRADATDSAQWMGYLLDSAAAASYGMFLHLNTLFSTSSFTTISTKISIYRDHLLVLSCKQADYLWSSPAQYGFAYEISSTAKSANIDAMRFVYAYAAAGTKIKVEGVK